MRYLSNLWSNIKYLMLYSLRERERELMYDGLNRVEDIYNYEIKDGNVENTLNILDVEQTLDLLLSKPKSFCRFGDGEIDIIQGRNIAFQVYDIKLAEKLKSILMSESCDLYIGLNYNLFHNTRNFSEYTRKFYLIDVKKYRDYLLSVCSKDITYISASFNQLYMCIDKYDFSSYYDKVLKLFEGKEIVIFCGEGILSKLQYDVFQKAKSKEYVYGPSMNAFSEYEQILEKALQYPKDKILCFILGPTSKVLVHELSQKGYCAWDIGHMAKDYDAFMHGRERTDEEIKHFFAPD